MRIKRLLLSLLPLTLLGVLPGSMQNEFPCSSVTRISGSINYSTSYQTVTSNIMGTFTSASCSVGGPISIGLTPGCSVINGQIGLPVQTVASGGGNYTLNATIYCAMQPTTVTHFACINTDCCSCSGCDGVAQSNRQETWQCQ